MNTLHTSIVCVPGESTDMPSSLQPAFHKIGGSPIDQMRQAAYSVAAVLAKAEHPTDELAETEMRSRFWKEFTEAF